MANITGPAITADIDLYSSQSTIPSGLYVGAKVEGANGKVFRYVKAGGSALVVGNVVQSPAVDTAFDDLAVAVAASAGDRTVTLTNGASTIAANDFDGGTFEVSVNSASGTNLGDEYTIIGHTVDASGNASVTFTLDRPLRTGLTTSTTKVTLRRSPWSGVIQLPTTQTGTPAGVAIYAIPAGKYGWVQSRGVAAVLSDNSTFAVGSALSNSVATAGCVGVFVAGTARSFIGHAMRASATGKTIPVQLAIE